MTNQRAFRLHFADFARIVLVNLQSNPALVKRCKAVNAALGKLQIYPRHPGLHTHKFSERRSPDGSDVFEAYAENNTLTASSGTTAQAKDVITTIAITAHP